MFIIWLIFKISNLLVDCRFGLKPQQARDGLLQYTLKNTDIKQFCIEEPICKQSKYRTADGSCNNLQRPLWGRSNTAMTRLVPPAYADGLNALRVSVDGSPLPGPREVSLGLAQDKDVPNQICKH